MTDLLTVRNTILIIVCIAVLLLWALLVRTQQRERRARLQRLAARHYMTVGDRCDPELLRLAGESPETDDDTDDYNWLTTTTRAQLHPEETAAPGWWPRRGAS